MNKPSSHLWLSPWLGHVRGSRRKSPQRGRTSLQTELHHLVIAHPLLPHPAHTHTHACMHAHTHTHTMHTHHAHTHACMHAHTHNRTYTPSCTYTSLFSGWFVSFESPDWRFCLEERGIKRGSPQQSSLRGWERASINQTDTGTLLKTTLGNFWDWLEHLWAFPCMWIPSWIKLNPLKSIYC